MKVVEFLDSKGVHYDISRHRPTFTAQQMAAEEHVPGMAVAKPVAVNADNRFYLCVLPACCKIDFDALRFLLKADKVTLADEDDMAAIFDDCTLGSEPPFGHLYGLETLMDTSLEDEATILFQAGTHELAIQMDMDDYKKLAAPRVMSFAYHTR